jgi:hypothetical protein
VSRAKFQAVRGLALALLCLSAAAGAGCAGKGGSAHGSAPSDARIGRLEQRDVDRALSEVPDAKRLVDSYHIEGELLNVNVDGALWKAIGPRRQDAFKHVLWSKWDRAYLSRNGPSTARVFLTVYDMGGNVLGSYFER